MDEELKKKRRKRNKIRKVKKRDSGGIDSAIDITPLVNVGLILLIIFMVITPMLSRGKNVPLPKTTQHETGEDNNQPVVAIDTKEDLWVGKERVDDLAAMEERLNQKWESLETPTRRVYLKVARTVSYGKVYPVIIALHELGLQDIELGTNERKR